MIFSKKAYLVYLLTLTTLMFISYFTLDMRVAHFFLADVKTYEPIGDVISILGESHWYIGTAILGFYFSSFTKKMNYINKGFCFYFI